MRTVALTPELTSAWNALALASSDAWFWQTPSWAAWSDATSAPAIVGRHSFGIVHSSGELIGVCPVNVEEREGERIFAFMGGPLPAPAFADSLAGPEREQAFEAYVRELEDLAGRERVARGSIKMPFTAALHQPGWYLNPFVRYGYFDLAYMTQVIDLRLDENHLWTAVRKGHRSDIKRAAQRATVRVWDRETITTGKIREYQALHAKDAGRVTRPQHTFDLMEGWIRDGHAILGETTMDNRAVAFAVIISYKTGAFYASGCRDPEVPDLKGSHLLQWEVMRWLKAHGCELYDIGIQFFGPQWFYVPTAKEISISTFKRGFGGETVPLVTAERFFDPECLKTTFEKRVRAYLEASAPSRAEV